ncbi:THAP domain-containing protein 5-like [Hyla sarda]|uniref:THAP domain-containing protein 5-like n=1 Tax=Hyla sarda TaxID=327740 RepID=UPI0024C29EAF|nr:THAP domain-containing protein 5-like [Hyla sarda]
MPKSCVVPECRRAETGRESYYKFPLHDKVRLKQWLTNMNMENFFPTKNQYLCSKHFKPSCFQIRWGVRYLRHDAVPTNFSSSSPSKGQVTKSRTLNAVQNVGSEVCMSTVPPFVIGNGQVLPDTLTIALDPNSSTGQIAIDGAELVVKNTDPTALMGAVNILPLVHFVESFDGLSLALAPSQGFQSLALPIVSGEHQIQPIPLVEQVGFLSEEHIATTTLQHNYYGGQVLQSVGEAVPAVIEIAGVSDPGALVMENISIEPFFEAGLPTPPPVTMSSEDVMSYLETMQTATLVPVMSSGPLPPMIPSQETILSSSTDRPIASTVPIVSKRNTEASSADGPQVISLEPSDGVTETLSTAQLVSVVMNLQKKVSSLQQRHQKHCSKLEVMEGVVDQLKNENLIADDKVNFMELACLNAAPVQTEETETIAIVCEDADRTLLYALPLQGENRTILHVTKQ